MSRVSQLLRSAHAEDEKVYTVSPGTLIIEVARLLRDRQIGALPVLEEGRLVGMISERDITFKVTAAGIDPKTVVVADFMVIDPAYVTPFTDVLDCLNLMKERKARHMPVLEGDKLVGIVSLRDVLHTLLKNQELLAQQFQSYILGHG